MLRHLAVLFAIAHVACGPKMPPPAPSVSPAADPLAERPTVGESRPFSPATPEVRSLANGAMLWVLAENTLPLVSLQVYVPGGAASDPDGKPGLTALADELLVHGAGDRDATAFAGEVERLALDLSATTTGTATLLALDAHRDRLEAGLDLLADAMLRPRFDADEVERVRQQQIGAIKQSLDDPRSVASQVAWAAWYGDNHPLAHPTLGTESGLTRVRPEALARSWKRRADPSRTLIVAAGAVEADALKALLDARLADWTPPRTGRSTEVPPAPLVEEGPRLRFVHVPDAAQTVLRVTLPGWPADAEEGPLADLGIIALGGTFTSRLNRLLREEKGYTYGARASLSRGAADGTVVITTNVRQDATAPALVDLLGEVRRLADGITAQELQKAAGSVRTDAIAAMSSRGSMVSTYQAAHARGQGPEAVPSELARAESATLDATNAALSRLDLSAALIVVAGDLDAMREAVETAVPGPWSVAEPAR